MWSRPLSNKAPLVANPFRSVYIAHNMASDGVENTPSAAILWSAWVCHWRRFIEKWSIKQNIYLIKWLGRFQYNLKLLKLANLFKSVKLTTFQ